jgi:23S rRNA (guanosine2251-2'-O)-methyltransferase
MKPKEIKPRVKNDVVVVLPDIRSSYNIGSIFRTSDATGVSKIYLCGYSPCPADKFNRPQKEIAKTALGAEKTIPWEYKKDIKKVIKDLKEEGFTVVAIEQDERSISYKKFFKKSGGKKVAKVVKVAIIFGNEVEGLPKKILDLCDYIVDIPMLGEKESLNVSVSAGIVLYELI